MIERGERVGGLRGEGENRYVQVVGGRDGVEAIENHG